MCIALRNVLSQYNCSKADYHTVNIPQSNDEISCQLRVNNPLKACGFALIQRVVWATDSTLRL